MKYAWTLFVVIPVVFMLGAFGFSQKYKNTFVPPSPTPPSTVLCTPKDIEAAITTEGAAGNIYGTLTLKNISSKNCQIAGDNFVGVQDTATNIVASPLGKDGPEEIILNPHQIVYAQIHYPNGPQCSSGIIETPVVFSYRISPKDTVVFHSRDNASVIQVTTCISSQEMTQIDVSSISLQLLH